MTQKFAAYNTQGQIIAFYDDIDSPVPEGITAIAITDEQWQTCLSRSGWAIANGQLVAPVPPSAAELLANTQTAQRTQLAAASQSAICAGFVSAALGTPHSYPSQDTDQRNLQSAMFAALNAAPDWSTPIWCAQGEAWELVAHNAAQVQQLNADWLAHRGGVQQHYAALLQRVNSAATPEDVQAIIWH